MIVMPAMLEKMSTRRCRFVMLGVGAALWKKTVARWSLDSGDATSRRAGWPSDAVRMVKRAMGPHNGLKEPWALPYCITQVLEMVNGMPQLPFISFSSIFSYLLSLIFFFLTQMGVKGDFRVWPKDVLDWWNWVRQWVIT